MLEAARVSKWFAGVPALRGVEFSLRRGQVHALVGGNGAGKSTLVKVLAGVYEPDEGMLFHRGEVVRFAGPRDAQARGISTVYQEINLVGSMSVSANLFLGREPRNRLGLVNFRHMHAAAARLLGDLGIDVDPRLPVYKLSHGEQRMIAIARAVDTDARVVILDEPTTALEPHEVDTLFAVIRRLHEHDVPVIYSSQRLLELFQICNAITVLRDGEVVHTGLMSDIGPAEVVATMLGQDTPFPAEHQAAIAEILNARDQASPSQDDNVDSNACGRRRTQ